MEMIEKHPDEDWNWNEISSNPNITMEIIENNPENPWNWEYISLNIFAKEKEAFIITAYREHLAALRIQTAYKDALVNPNCQLGINRIERDMDSLGLV